MSKTVHLFCLLTIVSITTADSRAQLFVGNAANGTLGEYNTDGTVITNALLTFDASSNWPYGVVVSGTSIYSCNPSGTVALSTDDGTFSGDIIIGLQSPFLGMTVSGTNMYVASPAVGYVLKYGLSPAGASLISFPLISGLASPSGGMAVVGTNLYVVDTGANRIGLYSTSGATINAAFITGLHQPYGLVITGTNLYVSSFASNSIGLYSSITGQTINAALITGLHLPAGLATDGTNLYVANFQEPAGDSIGSYTLTGATNNAALITGLRSPVGLFWRPTASAVTNVALSATVSGTNMVLTWPVTGATFRLRQNTNLNTTNWTVVTNIPVLVAGGTTNQVTLGTTNTTFFDLINP